MSRIRYARYDGIRCTLARRARSHGGEKNSVAATRARALRRIQRRVVVVSQGQPADIRVWESRRGRMRIPNILQYHLRSHTRWRIARSEEPRRDQARTLTLGICYLLADLQWVWDLLMERAYPFKAAVAHCTGALRGSSRDFGHEQRHHSEGTKEKGRQGGGCAEKTRTGLWLDRLDTASTRSS